MEEYGADFLTVHPRRGIDKYRGVAGWWIISLLRRELRLPVVGNGDVWYAQDALRMIEETGCGAVMPGTAGAAQSLDLPANRRASGGTGGVFAVGSGSGAASAEAAGGDGRGRLDGRPLPVGPLKGQFLFMIRAVPDGMAIRRRVLGLETCDAFLDGVEQALSSLSPEQLDLGARGRYEVRAFR